MRPPFAGRFANLWGVTDVAAFGEALVALHPEGDDPTKAVTRLRIENADTLRITEAGGFASPGETFRYTRDADGQITKIVTGGTSAYPVAVFRQRPIGS